MTFKSFRTGLSSGLWPLLFALTGVALAEDPIMEVIPLQHKPAAEMQTLLAPLLDPGDKIVDSGFDLIVKTTPTRLEALRTLIEKLDTQPVSLMVSVLQTSNKTAAELNAAAAVAVSPDAIRMGGLAGDTRNLSREQAVQQIRTLEGQAAHIVTGQIRPIQNFTLYGSPYGSPGIVSNTQMLEADTGFAVIPKLSGRTVLLDISPWSERFQRNGYIETQAAHTTLRAKLGEWVEIGGSDEIRQSQTGSFNQSTGKNTLQLLIKVDKLD